MLTGQDHAGEAGDNELCKLLAANAGCTCRDQIPPHASLADGGQFFMSRPEAQLVLIALTEFATRG